MKKSKYYKKAFMLAMKVGFLESREEFEMYVNALCMAMEWGDE